MILQCDYNWSRFCTSSSTIGEKSVFERLDVNCETKQYRKLGWWCDDIELEIIVGIGTYIFCGPDRIKVGRSSRVVFEFYMPVTVQEIIFITTTRVGKI